MSKAATLKVGSLVSLKWGNRHVRDLAHAGKLHSVETEDVKKSASFWVREGVDGEEGTYSLESFIFSGHYLCSRKRKLEVRPPEGDESLDRTSVLAVSESDDGRGHRLATLAEPNFYLRQNVADLVFDDNQQGVGDTDSFIADTTFEIVPGLARGLEGRDSASDSSSASQGAPRPVLRNEFQERNTRKLKGDYVYTSTVSHRGVVVSFAMTRDRRIRYLVLDLARGQQAEEIDRACWTDARELPFPSELSQTGYALVKNHEIAPRLREDGAPGEIDPFASTTAKLTALAPFQVISDGTYIYLYRQALDGGHEDVDRVLYTVTEKQGNKTVAVERKVPVVDSTLLVDRFVMSGTRLRLSREIRYQRSRHRTQPASRKDTLASADLEKKPFFEPTRELAFVGGLRKGGFAVLLMPTQETEVLRWQIFAYDTRSEKLQGFNVKRGSDGWFDATDSAAYVEAFLKPRGLGQAFEETIYAAALAPGFDATTFDGEQAGKLKENASFASALADVTLGELAELVFTIRTGLVKDDFSLVGDLKVTTGLSAVYYYQQEPDPRTGKPMKNLANVMLAMGLRKTVEGEQQDGEDAKDHLGVLNFAVSRSGRLARLPEEELALPDIEVEQLDAQELLTQLLTLRSWTGELKTEIVKSRTDFTAQSYGSKLLNWGPEAIVEDGESRTVGISRVRSSLIPRPLQTAESEERLSGLVEHTSSPQAATEAVELLEGRVETWKSALSRLDALEQEARDQVKDDGVPVTTSHRALDHDFVVTYRNDDVEITQTGEADGKARRRTATVNGRLSDIYGNLAFRIHGMKWGEEVKLSLLIDGENTIEVRGFGKLNVRHKGGTGPVIWTKMIRTRIDTNEDNNQVNVTRVGNGAYTFQLKAEGFFERVSCSGFNHAFPYKARGTVRAVDDRQLLRELIRVEGGSVLEYYRDRALPLLQQLEAVQNERDVSRRRLRGRQTATSMPLLAVDADGLRTSGGLLDFAYTADEPHLFDDALGRIGLYFRGRSGSFYSAYFNPSYTPFEQWTPAQQPGLLLHPQVRVDGELEVEAAVEHNTSSLTIRRTDLSEAVDVESWKSLPTASDDVAQVLNGTWKRAVGYARWLGVTDAENGKAELDLLCCASDLVPLEVEVEVGGENRTYKELVHREHPHPDVKILSEPFDDRGRAARRFHMTAPSATELPLGAFWSRNRVLLVGKLRMRIVAGSTAKVIAVGGLSKDELGTAVPEASLEAVWERLLNGKIIGRHDEKGQAFFVSNAVFGSASGLRELVRPALAEGEAVSPFEDGVIELLLEAAQRRKVTLRLEYEPEVKFPELHADGDAVYLTYDYAANFSCDPSALAKPSSGAQSGLDSARAFTTVGWGHERSMLFQAGCAEPMDMGQFTTKKRVSKVFKGQWESGDPGLALSLERSLESGERSSRPGLLTSGDTSRHKLQHLAPTSDGLTLEAWIHPRKGASTERRVLNYCHDPEGRGDGQGYCLGIRGDGDSYTAFAQVDKELFEFGGPQSIGRWTHLALSYDKHWALRLDKGTRINCGNDPALTPLGEFSIELFFAVHEYGTVLDKGRDFRFAVDGQHSLSLEMGGEDRLDGLNLRVALGRGIEKGKFYKLAVIRSRARLRDHDSQDDYPITGGESRSEEEGSEKWWVDKSTDEMAKGLAEKVDQMEHRLSGTTDLLGVPLTLDSATESTSSHDYYYSVVLRESSEGEHRTATTSKSVKTEPEGRDLQDLVVGSDGFSGTLDEVRLWGRALTVSECGKQTNERGKGMLAWWRLSESDGRAIYDDAGQSHGFVQKEQEDEGDRTGFRWIASPNVDLDRHRFYIDGQLQRYESKEQVALGVDQLSLGGYKVENGDTLDTAGAFDGMLDEVRIWGVARTSEQISDNAFGRLKGERGDLLAYYNFDLDLCEQREAALESVEGLSEGDAATVWTALHSANYITYDGGAKKEEADFRVKIAETLDGESPETVKAAADVFFAAPLVSDLGYQAIHLEVDGQLWSGEVGEENVIQVLSSAPISAEIPSIRSALAGVELNLHARISSSPSVVEYGDVQRNDDGTIDGVLKRCYSFIIDGTLHLVTGYKVGNLITEWLGQAQFAPQVVGYIEGPPPVPGENFPIAADNDVYIYAYNLDNSVELEQSDEVSVTYSQSKEHGYQRAAESEMKLGSQIEAIVAPLGVGLGIEIAGTFKWASSYEREELSSEAAERTVSTDRTRTLSATLAGYDNGKEGSERYYAMGNTGYALVKSRAADVYVLRLKHNNAMVSIYMMPNPDLPEDQNVITFPIDTKYVKQGTLDGKFGTGTDPSYPQATSAYGANSYYKPREAYGLKTAIERQRQRVYSYYEDFSTEYNPQELVDEAFAGMTQLAALIPGGTIATTLFNQTIGRLMTGSLNSETDLQAAVSGKMSQRSLVNTYVWTVEGGFYAESTEVADVRQETVSSDFSVALSGGQGVALEAKAGGGYEQDTLWHNGSSFSTTLAKTKEASSSFGLNVSVDIPTSPRYRYDEEGTLKKGLIGAGVVDAYRFMSFYLEPDAHNYSELFTTVIDSKWLEESPDPNARALRQARSAARQPHCWRVLHRVTFVSRILPEFDVEAPPSLEKVMRAKHIESNYMLIKIFDPCVALHTKTADILGAIDKMIDDQLPEFAPYRAEIKAYVLLAHGLE